MAEYDYRFEPRSNADREFAAYRSGGSRRRTRLAVQVEGDGGPLALINNQNDEALLLLRAMVLGLSILTDHDLLAEASNGD